MTENSYLLLSFEHPDNVIFTRGKYVQEGEWEELVIFWKGGRFGKSDCHYFKVKLSKFYDYRQWFNSSWKSKGRKVDVSESLKQALSKHQDFFNNFSNALNGKCFFDVDKINTTNLKRILTENQKLNVASSIAINNGANFSVPGAGKTTATLAVWNHFFHENYLNKLFVVCPLSVIDSWALDEVPQTFHKSPKTHVVSQSPIDKIADIILVNYEKLEQPEIQNKLIDWAVDNEVMMVLDEAHRVKGGMNSVRWRCCKEIAQHCKRVELLTGTPMPQGYSDLRNLFTLSWGNLPNNLISNNALSNLKPGGVFVRTTKKQLNLPPVKIVEIPLEPTDIQYQIYSALKKTYSGILKIEEGSEKFLGKKGSAVMTLIAAATNPGLILGREAEASYLDFSWPPKEIDVNTEILSIIKEYAKFQNPPPKYNWLLKFIRDSAQVGKKTLIWSNFIGNIESIHRLLVKQNNSPAIVHGGVKNEDRRKEIDRFRYDPNCHALLTNPQTLGEGISLHKCCNQSVYIDRTFNLVHYLQSLDRIHRLGLNKDVITNVYILTTNHTIDSRIDTRLKTKISRMSDSLNDDSLFVSSNVVYEENEKLLDLKLDNDDVRELLSHLSS